MRLQSAICFSILSVAFSILLVDRVDAQRFDVEEYLKKIDKDGNGVLDENEMSGRTKSFISRMGVDTDRPVKVSDVVAKVKRGRREWEERRAKENAPPLKVPGFGLTESKESNGSVPGFGQSDTPSGGRTQQFSKEVQERVNDVLERYDRNKDGILDQDEIRRGRWGSPKPEESDANRDGKLSRTELATRYVKRDQYYDNNGDRNRGRGDSNDRSSRGQSTLERTEAIRLGGSGSTNSFRRSSSRGATSSRPTSSRSSSGSSRSSSSSSDRAKYEGYAEGLIKRYDENKSGALEKDEIGKMRRPPKADANNDGTITKDELIDNLMGGSSSSSSSSTSSDSSSRSASDRGSRSSSRSRSSRGGSSGSFEELDANTDARIHMYEFSDEWNEEKVKEFYDKDKNGDGVITLEEWRAG